MAGLLDHCAFSTISGLRRFPRDAVVDDNQITPEELALVAADRAVSIAPDPDLRVSPRHIGLTGLRTFLWMRPPRPIHATASVPGLTVTAYAQPHRYVWSFGDGARRTTTHPGRRWTRRRPGNIGHTYERKGSYQLAATIVWRATWNVNGGPARPLGTFTTTTQRPYRVREVIPILVRWR